MSELDSFRAYYANVLKQLYPVREAGIPVIMISLPLAERYLRLKCNLSPDQQLTDNFMMSLVKLLPALRDVETARQFWNVYRNGFLHQATLSLSTRAGDNLPKGILTHDVDEAVQIQGDGSFCVNPVRFSQAIVSAIELDFAVFADAGGKSPPLPKQIPMYGSQYTYMGTSNQ